MYSMGRNRVCHICSYQQRSRRTTVSVQDVVKWVIGDVIARLQLGVDSVHQRHMQPKHAENMKVFEG